jgi:DNA-directed RNA polymerase subunit alpha
MPYTIELDEKTATDTYGKFTASPLKSGFGHTLGNAFRRILLSSTDGAAISAVRLDDAVHEFTSIPNVVEDVTEIILNFKKVLLKVHSDEKTKLLEIKKDKAGPVTAANIITDGTVDILNPDQVLCTLDKDGRFRAEIEITKGVGYVPAEKNKKPNHPVGTIPVDSLYSPVTRVKYHVGAARVGEETEMDNLVIEIWTDARVSPKDALENSANIMRDHLAPFLGEKSREKKDELPPLKEEEKKQLDALLSRVSKLELSVRSRNCLQNANIRLIGELCMKPEAKMMKYRNFGRKSLQEIKNKLQEMELHLDMKFDDKITAAIENEIKKISETATKEDEY